MEKPAQSIHNEPIKYLCVFCGSSAGSDPAYLEAAAEMGRCLVRHGYGLVYGGGSTGMMGTVARTVLKENGRVIGVIPRYLFERDAGFKQLSDLRVVEDMHTRKQLMFDLSDGFIAMPGGFGTLEEIFEVITWGQLGIHQKPCGLLNARGCFEYLLRYLEQMQEQCFITRDHLDMLLSESDPDALLEKMNTYQPPFLDKVADAFNNFHSDKARKK